METAMNNPTDRERVIFRRWRDTGDVIAFFPDQREEHGLIGSYMYVGQHSVAAYPNNTKPADVSEPDVAALKTELESIGYVLRVVRRRAR